MPLRHTVLRGEAKPKPRNVPPLDCQGDRSNSKRATAAVSVERDAQRKVHDKGREEEPVDWVERKTVSDVRSGSKGMSRRSKAVPAQVADGNEDHSQSYPERIGSKESTGSNGRFKKQISRLSSKTALMSEDPTQQFGGTLRGYMDFLYREAEQQLMWEKLDAATNRLSTIQEAQDLEHRPVVSLTSRNSISQMKSARTAAFETLEDEEAAKDPSHVRRHSQTSLDGRVRRQSAVVIEMTTEVPIGDEEGEEANTQGKPRDVQSKEPDQHPLKDQLTAKKVNINEVREILKHLEDLPRWLEEPLVSGSIPKPLIVAVADNNPDLVGLLIEFRADFSKPYDAPSSYKGWIKPGQSLLSCVSNRKGRFVGTMLADRLTKIEEMLTVQDAEQVIDDLDALEVGSSKSAFGAIAATWGTDELSKPRHTQGHPKGVYEVLERLDDGDTSTVWGGVHLPTKVSVAIKIEVKSAEVEMWEEIDIMRRLRHPNICRLFETFESETQVFMVLELCLGRLYDSLAVKEDGGYAVCRSPRFLRQLVLAVACLHDRKICHRDVQLENFLLMKEDASLEEATPKLIDFTTAKDYSGGQVLVTKVCTPTYVAKEILSRKMEPYTEKVDIWSLGVVFFIMFCGHPPFWGETDFEILTKVKKGIWSFQPSTAWKGASKQGMDLIQKMIVPVAERYSAQDVLRHEFLLS